MPAWKWATGFAAVPVALAVPLAPITVALSHVSGQFDTYADYHHSVLVGGFEVWAALTVAIWLIMAVVVVRIAACRPVVTPGTVASPPQRPATPAPPRKPAPLVAPCACASCRQAKTP